MHNIAKPVKHSYKKCSQYRNNLNKFLYKCSKIVDNIRTFRNSQYCMPKSWRTWIPYRDHWEYFNWFLNCFALHRVAVIPRYCPLIEYEYIVYSRWCIERVARVANHFDYSIIIMLLSAIIIKYYYVFYYWNHYVSLLSCHCAAIKVSTNH